MPSGHSQAALLFSTYKILELMKKKNNNPFFYATFVFLAVFIPWSRVYNKLHTVQQTIVGGILGITLGSIFFAVKSNILKLIFK
jgi:membrane-associated phospholipid phosphatase